MKNKCGIYGFKNILNGKWYIGQSTMMLHRKVEHLSKLRRGLHRNLHLQLAFNIYGEGFFEFRILQEVPELLLDVFETAWIELYKSNQRDFGYNSEAGGCRNKHPSAETLEKMSNAKKGKHPWNYGKSFSFASREKMSIAHLGHNGPKCGHYGKPHSEKTKRILRKKTLNYWANRRKRAL